MNGSFRTILRNAALTLPAAVAFIDCVAYVAKVEGVSMQPCLNPDGQNRDFVFLNRWAVRNFKINRGDIVAFKSPRDPGQKLIKRVIGMEGDVIRTLSYKKRYISVPKGHCWVEGDHNKQSMDSNCFGPVAVGLITAKASHIVWPPSRWRMLQPNVPLKRHPVSLSPNGENDVTDTENENLTVSQL